MVPSRDIAGIMPDKRIFTLDDTDTSLYFAVVVPNEAIIPISEYEVLMQDLPLKQK